MKQQLIVLGLLCCSLAGVAQQDSTAKAKDHPGNENQERPDSLTHKHGWRHWNPYPKQGKPANLSTNWIVVDLGFSNFTDKTDYSGAGAQAFAPGAADNWFHTRTGKSVNVGILLFMQRLNVIKHVVNLEYGLGIELNNYRYRDPVKYLTDPTTVFMDTITYKKNKLAADYFTMPLMLNFNFTPGLENGFGFSIGASAGYLYGSRQKLVSDEWGKHKTRDDFDLRPWKISWVAELQLGPVKLYGSYATRSMFKRGLNQVPYTVGLRFGNW